MLSELYPDSMACAPRGVAEQVALLKAQAEQLQQESDLLFQASAAPNAIIVYPYDAAYPTPVFVGDTVYTKYGDEGKVIAVDKVKDTFTLQPASGDAPKTFEGHRLSGITARHPV